MDNIKYINFVGTIQCIRCKNDIEFNHYYNPEFPDLEFKKRCKYCDLLMTYTVNTKYQINKHEFDYIVIE